MDDPTPVSSDASSLPELTDRVALVTGGGSGIGRATAEVLAAAGAAVAVADRDEDKAQATAQAIRADDGTALPVCADVSQPDAVDTLLDTVASALGPIGVAANCAGIEGPKGRMHELEATDWDPVMDVNLRGVWLCLRAELEHMLPHGGSIVNIASVFGSVGMKNASLRVAADHGVVGLTKAAALEYARDGIRVNAVCPSFVDTEMQVRMGTLIHPEERQSAMHAHPMERFAHADEVARAVAWLASDASSFVTGQTINVDGGYTTR